jgi:thiol-disulfide isomerase/thioredoxin
MIMSGCDTIRGQRMKPVLALLLLLGLSAGSASVNAQEPRKAPELSFTLPGQGEKLLSQYRGKVIALEFILTTCPHCQQASQLMSQLQHEYGSRGFQALDVAINAQDEGRSTQQANDIVGQFAQTYQTAFPVGWTSRDQMISFMNISLAERFVVPQLILIDRKGLIRYQTESRGDGMYENSMKPEVIRQRIEELLAAPSSALRRPARRPS